MKADRACKRDLPERGAATDDARSVTRQTFDGLTAEERVVLDASLPEVLARVTGTEVELHRVLVVTLSYRDRRAVLVCIVVSLAMLDCM